MNETKKDNLILFTIEQADRINNFVDCDVLAEAINELQEAKTDQTKYDAMNYIKASIEYRGRKSKAIDNWIKEFASEMSLLDHIQNKNSEALEVLKIKADNGDIIRIM